MRGAGSSPFNLLRYFAGASFAIVLVTTLVAGIASAALVRAVFTQMERDDAENVAQYFITEFAQDGFTRDRWGAGTMPPEARRRALLDMRNFDLLELKLLAPDGRELETLIAPGRTASDRWAEGLDQARAGRVALRWEAAGGWRSVLFSARPSGAIESYVPILESGAVVAVAKVRHDLEPAVTAAQKSLFVIVALSGAAGFAIFGALTLLVHRADRIIRRQHAQIQEIKRRKDQVYAACSHDLRSPLVSARAGMRLALEDPGTPLRPQQREILEDCARSLDEVLDLIGTLLDIARFEQVADRVDIRPVDLADVLERAVATHRMAAAAHGVEILTTFPDAPVVVEGDRATLGRVFGNLLSNAIKHASGRPVRVTLDSEPGHARVCVADEGPGIAPEHRETLFQRFRRGPDEREEGAGLGLAIVREFVVGHGGSVTCESEPGRGTRFVVLLPSHPPVVTRAAS